MLCSFCQKSCVDVLDMDLKLDASNKRNGSKAFCSAQTTQELDQGVRFGCYICLKFRSKMAEADLLALQQRCHSNPDDYFSSSWAEALAVLGTPAGPSVAQRLYLSVSSKPPHPDERLPSEDEKKAGCAAGFRILPARGIVQHLIPNIAFGSSTRSDLSMAQVRKWLDNCLTTHPGCKKPNARRGPFPSRLLAVETDMVRVSEALLAVPKNRTNCSE